MLQNIPVYPGFEEGHLVCPPGIRSGFCCGRQELGNIARLGGLSRGLSQLILWLGIRTCAGEIYPYVRREDGAVGGYQLPGMCCSGSS